MSATSDYNALLKRDPFRVSVTAGTNTGVGLVAFEDLIEGDGLGGQMQTRRRVLTIPTDQFVGLARDAAITVDGTAYTVQAVLVEDDGVTRKVVLR